MIVLVGPTATGKSALAMALAEELGGEIINADALQVYRGFDIGTAKPTAEERRRVPHHLVDILEPHQRYSAGEFARRAREAVAGIRARGRRPIVVGGSGLYLRALLQGISPVPRGEPELRRELRRRLEEEGPAALKAELARLDPVTAERLPAGDTQRILRALEVAQSSGKPLSAWIEAQPFGRKPLSARTFGLTLRREVLYDRIADRARRMVERGWIEEVAGLLDRGLDPRLPAFQAIGYRQLSRHARGEISLEQALADIVTATRRFAKRQMTWFRKEPGVTWLEESGPEQRVSLILDALYPCGPRRSYGKT